MNLSSVGGMKITVHYKSGEVQVFIVPAEIHVTEFQEMAKKVGGEVLRVEFTSFGSRPHRCHAGEGKH